MPPPPPPPPPLVLVLGLGCALAALLSLCAADTNSIEQLNDKIYTSVPSESSCVTLATKDHLVGCHTPRSKLSGKIIGADTVHELNALFASDDADRLAIVMPRQMLSKSVVRILSANENRVAGVLFKPITVSSPTQISPAATSPLNHLSPESASVEWNPQGQDLLEERMNFAILQLLPDSWPDILQKLKDNESRRSSGSYERNYVEFSFKMLATSDSVTCLRKFQCQPVGGYSVWASLGGSVDSEKPLVMATASMDSNALIHSLASGGDANASGLVALLAAVKALSGLGWETLSALSKQIIVASFNGEAFDLVGSRRFVQEFTSFRCDQTPSDNDRVCLKPVRGDLAFKSVSLQKLDTLLELQQVGFNGVDGDPVLYTHRATTSPDLTTLEQSLSESANNVGGITIKAPSVLSNGMPPSSSWTFVREKPDIAAIVLAEHDGAFTNKFYHSVADSSFNSDHVCKVASLTAQTLFREAGGNKSVADSLSANCSLVNRLMECLTVDFNCSLSRSLLSEEVIAAHHSTSRYAGVYIIGLALAGRVVGIPRLVYEFMKNTTADIVSNNNQASCKKDSDCSNQQYCLSGHCSLQTTHFHDAVDTSIEFDYSNNKWIVNTNTSSRIWTESNWDVLRTRSFATSSSLASGLAVGIGFLTALLTYGFTKLARQYGSRRFKVD